LDPLEDPAALEGELTRHRRLIAEAVELHNEDLLVAARVYASKFGLPDRGESAAEVAQDLVQATVVRAFEIADRFDPNRLARPWLLGLLLNVSKEERRRRYRIRRHTSSISAAIHANDGGGDNAHSEEDLFERLRKRHHEIDLAAEVQLEDLLGLVSDQDQEVLRLSVVEDRSGRDVAAHLGITEGAANVRVHRALGRLSKEYARLDDSTKRV
jgi:RNA polymerase sigma factor (sigma-70 family)